MTAIIRLGDLRPLFLRLLVLAGLVLVPPMAILSALALAQFEQVLAPELDNKVAAIGHDLAGQVERALGYGIPLDRLAGMGDFFQPVLKANPEIRYLAVTDMRGRVMAMTGAERHVVEPHYRAAEPAPRGEARKSLIADHVDLSLALAVENRVVGHVHVGIVQGYAGEMLHSMIYDVLVAMAAALVVAFEVLLCLVTVKLLAPLDLAGKVMERAGQGDFTQEPAVPARDEMGRLLRAIAKILRRLDDQYRRLKDHMGEIKAGHFDKNVVEQVGEVETRMDGLFRFSPKGKPVALAETRAGDIRLPLFLFLFAEELSRSFLPLYVRDLGQPFRLLSPEFGMAIPIFAFMGCVALFAPVGGWMARRWGARRAFLIGLVPALLGTAMSAAASGFYDLMLWRAMAGSGYALVVMACQSHVTAALDKDDKLHGLGIMVGAMLSASLGGMALGGVLAEQLGYGASFMVSAALVALAGFLASRLLVAGDKRQDAPAGEPLSVTLAGNLFRDWRFAMLMLFSAVPASLALTGFLFFLVPVMLSAADWDLAAIARILVLYPLVSGLVSTLSRRTFGQPQRRTDLVAAGGLIGGLGLMTPLVVEGVAGPILGVIALGAAHGLAATSRLSLIPDLCRTDCRLGQTGVLALVRLLEHCAAALGPILMAAFIAGLGTGGAMVALGVAMALVSLVFAVSFRCFGDGIAQAAS